MPGPIVETKARLSAAEISSVQDLATLVGNVDGTQALGDQKWIDLIHGGAPGFCAFLVPQPSGPGLAGYGQLSGGGGTWGLETLVHPAHRVTPGVLEAILRGARSEVQRRGGGELRYWVKHPSEEQDGLITDLGFGRWRNLLQLRVPLPLPAEIAQATPGVSVRAFRVGVDEDAWLTMNNRAFATHPEQGGWNLETLLEREQEPWFDPDGFLVSEKESRLVAACWTKIHEAHEPPLGEIYVIAVDPSEHGRGLGRAMTVAGLEWLGRQGLRDGMLYVDESNTVAVKLYASLGFVTDHADRAYRVVLEGPD